MRIEIVEPTVARILDFPAEEIPELRKKLSFTDEKVAFALKKARHSNFLRRSLGDVEYQKHLAELQKEKSKCLLFEDDKGYWTYSGVAHLVARHFGCPLTDSVTRVFGKRTPLPWHNPPKKDPRYYQTAAKEALLEVKHGAVEIGTGLGKSFIIQMLIKELGQRSVVMAPSVNIAQQLFDEMTHHFGKKYVGFYGDGKKDVGKLITVAVSQSLTKVQKDTPAWNFLSGAQVFIADESHQTPAKTLAQVCFGLLKDAPCRFFFSGTQIRSDGLGIVLSAITGPIVYRMTVREGVDQGFLAKPIFTMIQVESESSKESKDANTMTRAHLYYNEKVYIQTAKIVHHALKVQQRPVLVLVEEIEQYERLKKHLHCQHDFAHGGPSCDPSALVEAFNRKKLDVLVGTSCVSTGTDIRVVGHIIFLMGGKSEVLVKQAVGRGTRLAEGKVDCYFTDFDVVNVESCHKHATERVRLYEEIYGPVRTVGAKT